MGDTMFCIVFFLNLITFKIVEKSISHGSISHPWPIANYEAEVWTMA